MGTPLKDSVRRYPIYVLIWTVFGLFMFTQGLLQKVASQDPTPWWHYLISYMVGVNVWALLMPLVVWLAERFPFDRRTWPLRVPLHAVLSLVVALTQLSIESSILPHLKVFPTIMKDFGSTFGFLLLIGIHEAILTYWMVLGVQHGIVYYRGYQERKQQAMRLEVDAAELRTQLVGAQLNALKMQLQPHFLFNTLNAIMVLVRQQKGRQAEEMLSRLSDLLRGVLEDVGTQEVPLRRELEQLRLYLSIEEVRFQDRMRVEITADPGALDAAVPHLGLQPIVENAIRHGIGRSSAAGRIRIHAACSGGMLRIEVRDDGPGLPPAQTSGSRGIGLANTRARLAQLYGDRARLLLENGEAGGAVATMELPLHMAPRMSEAGVMEVHAFDDSDRG